MYIPDSTANRAVYGLHGAGHAVAGYPMLRLLTVVATGCRHGVPRGWAGLSADPDQLRRYSPGVDVHTRHLRYFVAVAEELNLTRAAGRLHVAQQALSAQVKQLEKDLGLHRSTRSVDLTAAGSAILEVARSLLSALNIGAADARRIQESETSTLTLGLGDGAALTLTEPDCNRHFEFFTFPHSHLAMTKTSNPVDAAVALGRAASRTIPLLNRVVSRAGGYAHRLDRSGRIFATPRRVRFNEMGYAIPHEHSAAAVRAVRDVAQRREFEVFNSFAGHPHWSKHHSQTAETPRPRYLEWDKFAAVRGCLDPKDMFTNGYIGRVLGQACS
ncbi:D-arabinono-1,4-lactone oxidase [Nocardia australiensis]|uniref:D-arabinono-1,4-lactone oxidase n=1 Tax=Nocardia australiensis TaxID=2887191 RepID=UPI003558D477